MAGRPQTTRAMPTQSPSCSVAACSHRRMVSPAQMRATRDLLRRRMPLARQRAELLAHVQHTNSQYNLPAIGKKMASKATRAGVAARFADPAVHKSIAVDLRAPHLRRCSCLATSNAPSSTPPSTMTPPPSLCGTPCPASARCRSLVLLDDIHAIHRFPRGQDVVASGRLVPWAQAAAGKRWGTSGPTIGKAHLTWAFSAAAVWCLRDPPAAQHYLPRLEKQPAKGPALTGLAQQVARAVSHRRTRQVACERETCCQRSGRGVGEPGASRDTDGLNLPDALDPAGATASLHAKARRGREPLSPALGLAIRARACLRRRESPTARVGCSSPAPSAHWTPETR